MLAMVNGVGDFVSSFAVGLLWAKISPAVGFVYASALTFIGGIVLFLVRKRT
jgi:dipeptide/tripeptide permease